MRKRAAALPSDHAETIDLDDVGSVGSHDASDTLDRFPCATLTECVLGFLERYNQSVWIGIRDP